ncbi:hypothetical protein GCM10009550_39190 [Actinocorallia libanotica]|uniref:Uncharacterized protein n=2 Tax=Actinocorallia libanotica TaxID=46162 RepID=A0ABN1RCR0_9ACTN
MPPKTNKKIKKRKKSASDRTMSASSGSSSDSDSRPGSAMSVDSDGPDTHSTPIRGSRPSPMDLGDDDGPSSSSNTRIGPSDRTSFQAGGRSKRAWSDGSDSDADPDSDGPSRLSSAVKRVRVAVPVSDQQGKPANGPVRPSTAGPSPSSGQSPGMAALTALIGPLPPPDPGPQAVTVAMNPANVIQPNQGGAALADVPQQPVPDLNAFKRDGTVTVKDVNYYPIFSVENGLVGTVNFGTTRTPSPFGAEMGDHTAAWTGVVDSLHASVFGKTLQGAVQELRRRQESADSWMDGPLPDGTEPAVLKLWKMLDEDDRQGRYEQVQGYAFKVRGELDSAQAVIDAAAADPAGPRQLTKEEERTVSAHLSEALGHHAAYRNMLPLATVRVPGGRGSIGSGEGTARNNILTVEIAMNEKSKNNNAPDPDPDKAREGLTKLFSMTAATREARLGEALNPKKRKEARERIEGIDRYVKVLATEIDAIILLPVAGGTTARQPTRLVPGRTLDDVLTALTKATDPNKTVPPAFAPETEDENSAEDAVYWLSRKVREVVGGLKLLSGQKVSATDLGKIKKEVEKLAKDNALGPVIDRMSKTDAEVRAETGLMLAHMINEHQSNMADAYPETVKLTGFLQNAAGVDDPAGAAGAMLEKFISEGKAKKTLDVEPGEEAHLLAAFAAQYDSLNHLPQAGAGNGWVVGSRNDGLVVGIRKGDPVILGRAAPPPGIEGMGSHSTAWKTETDAVKQWFKEVRENRGGDAAIIDHFKAETERDLQGKLMTELAPVLNTGQLDKGQLEAVAKAAYEVRTAGTPEQAIRAYLTFRNVLPFATVNSGDRGGHGEGTATTSKGLFDRESLEKEAEARADDFEDDADSQITAVKAAIAKLKSDSATRYATDQDFVKMIGKVADAMTRKADSLATNPAKGYSTTIKNLITKTRKEEHDRVYAVAKKWKPPATT